MYRGKKRDSGSKRMLQLHKKPVQIWLSRKQYDLIKAAADRASRPMTQYIIISVMSLTPSTLKGDL